MPITMTITAENPTELFETIKGCAVLITDDVPAAVPSGDVKPPKAAPAPVAVPVAAPANTPATVPASQPAPAATPKVPAPVPAPAVPVTNVPAYTQDQIAMAGHSLLEAGKMDALIALLNKHGVQAVTELKPEQFGPVATELRALGAKI